MEKKRQVKARGNGLQSLKGKEEGVRIFQQEVVNHQVMQEQDGKCLRFSAGSP